MALRFRRRIKILPGVHVNVSRAGISTSIGVRGASMTFGKRGTYTNVGIPGTGVSWRERVDAPQPKTTALPNSNAPMNTTEQTVVVHHHLHWWKVAIFFVSMVLAAATKSNAVIGFFWAAWFAYWGFLFVRMLIRTSHVPVQK